MGGVIEGLKVDNYSAASHFLYSEIAFSWRLNILGTDFARSSPSVISTIPATSYMCFFFVKKKQQNLLMIHARLSNFECCDLLIYFQNIFSDYCQQR